MATTKQLLTYQKRLSLKSTDSEVRAKELLSTVYEFPKDIQEQFIFGHYILDFVIPEKLLAIEVDGGIHTVAAKIKRDQRRDKFCAKYGLQTLRVRNEDVEGILSQVGAYPNLANWKNLWILAVGAASVPQFNLNKVMVAKAKLKKAQSTKRKRKKKR